MYATIQRWGNSQGLRIPKALLDAVGLKEHDRVELVQMDDPQAPPIGTKGTVIGVDDIGSVMVAWDTGSGLNVAYGVDVCRKVANTDDR